MSGKKPQKGAKVATVKPTMISPAPAPVTIQAQSTATTLAPGLTVSSGTATQNKASQLMLSLSQLQAAINMATLTGQPQVIVQEGTVPKPTQPQGSTSSPLTISTHTAGSAARLMMVPPGGQTLQTQTPVPSQLNNSNFPLRIVTPTSGSASNTPLVLQMVPPTVGSTSSTTDSALTKSTMPAKVVFQSGSTSADSTPLVCHLPVTTSAVSATSTAAPVVLQSATPQTSTKTTAPSGAQQLYQMVTVNVNGVLKTVMVPVQQPSQQPQQVVVQCPAGQTAQTMNIITSPTTNLIVQNGNTTVAKPVPRGHAPSVRAQLRTALNVSRQSQGHFLPRKLAATQSQMPTPNFEEIINVTPRSVSSEIRILPESVMSLSAQRKKTSPDTTSAQRNPTLTSLLRVNNPLGSKGGLPSHTRRGKSPVLQKRSPEFAGDESRSLSPFMYEINGDSTDREDSPPRVLFKNGRVDAVITTTPSEVVEVNQPRVHFQEAGNIPTVVSEKESPPIEFSSSETALSSKVYGSVGQGFLRYIRSSTPKPPKMVKKSLFCSRPSKGPRIGKPYNFQFHNVSFRQVNDTVKQVKNTSSQNSQGEPIQRENSTGFTPHTDSIYSVSDSEKNMPKKRHQDDLSPSRPGQDQAPVETTTDDLCEPGTGQLSSVVRGDNLQVRIAREVVKTIPYGQEEILMVEPGPASEESDIDFMYISDSESEDPWAIPLSKESVKSTGIPDNKDSLTQDANKRMESVRGTLDKELVVHTAAADENTMEMESLADNKGLDDKCFVRHQQSLSATIDNLRQVVSEISQKMKRGKHIASQDESKVSLGNDKVTKPIHRRSNQRASASEGIRETLQRKSRILHVCKNVQIPKVPPKWKNKYPMLKDCSVRMVNFLRPGSVSDSACCTKGAALGGRQCDDNDYNECGMRTYTKGNVIEDDNSALLLEKNLSSKQDRNLVFETFCHKVTATSEGNKVLVPKYKTKCSETYKKWSHKRTGLARSRKSLQGQVASSSSAVTFAQLLKVKKLQSANKEDRLKSWEIGKMKINPLKKKPPCIEHQPVGLTSVDKPRDSQVPECSPVGDIHDSVSTVGINSERDSSPSPNDSKSNSPIPREYTSPFPSLSSSAKFPPYPTASSSSVQQRNMRTRSASIGSSTDSNPSTSSSALIKLKRQSSKDRSAASIGSSTDSNPSTSSSALIKLKQQSSTDRSAGVGPNTNPGSTHVLRNPIRSSTSSKSSFSKSKCSTSGDFPPYPSRRTRSTSAVSSANSFEKTTTKQSLTKLHKLQRKSIVSGSSHSETPALTSSSSTKVNKSASGPPTSADGADYVVMDSSQLLVCLAQTATKAAEAGSTEVVRLATTSAPGISNQLIAVDYGSLSGSNNLTKTSPQAAASHSSPSVATSSAVLSSQLASQSGETPKTTQQTSVTSSPASSGTLLSIPSADTLNAAVFSGMSSLVPEGIPSHKEPDTLSSTGTTDDQPTSQVKKRKSVDENETEQSVGNKKKLKM